MKSFLLVFLLQFCSFVTNYEIKGKLDSKYLYVSITNCIYKIQTKEYRHFNTVMYS